MQSQHFIDGHWVSDGQWADSLDPANGEAIGRFADGGEAQARAAVAAATAAFAKPQWAQNPRLRQQLLLDWAVELKARHESLAQLLSRENGKALTQSRGEIAGAISEIIYYAGLARHNPGHVLEVAPGEFSSLLREPAGVAGLIIPWNAPAVLLIRALAPAIAAGCTSVIKPAPQTALFNAAILEPLLNLPGLPAGAVNLFAETGHAGAGFMVASPDVDVLSFTGSTATGQRIMQDAAATMKKLSLELGENPAAWCSKMPISRPSPRNLPLQRRLFPDSNAPLRDEFWCMRAVSTRCKRPSRPRWQRSGLALEPTLPHKWAR